MNGVRSTFMRRGYLLTALAAAALIAASPGTAAAQNRTGITITGPAQNTVNEGGTATYTVTVRGYVGVATGGGGDPVAATAPDPITVTLALPTVAGGGTPLEGELADLNANAHVRMATFDPPENTSTTNRLLFTASKTISVATLHDNDAENESFGLVFGTGASDLSLLFRIADADAEGGGATIALADNSQTANVRYNPNMLIIADDETQGYKLTQVTEKPMEGTGFMVSLEASPAHEDGNGSLTVNLDKPTTGTQPPWTLEGTNPVIVGVGNGGVSKATFTITQNADGNRVTDTVTVSAHTGRTGASKEEHSLSIDVADANLLPAVTAMVVDDDGVVLKAQPESVEEGKSVKIRVMPVDKDGKVEAATEDLEITLASSGSADARDFRLSAPIKIDISANATQSNVVDLIVETDEDVGMETLVLDATVSGVAGNGRETSTSAGVLSIDIVDTTEEKIAPKSEDDAYSFITDPMEEAAGDDGLNPSESFMVTMSDLFELAIGYEATYGADSDGSAVSISERGDVVTVTAEEAGTSKVTVTATAGAAASSFAPSQTVSNVAQVAFEVTVVDKELVVTLAADPMEIDEGDMSTITATANRAVVANDGDVVISLTATGGELDSDTITIAMGEMSGTAMLTAAADDDTNDATVTVVASGSGIDGNATLEIAVNDTTEAPEPTNAIEAKPEDEAYPIITGAIDAGAGEEGLNPGESATMDAAELFTVMEGYTASYAADVDGDAASASVSGSHVTVMADSLGEAKVTITGTATAASSSFQAGQPAANVATVTFAVMVVDKGLKITLHGPDNVMAGNLVEGSEYHLTVKANRVVREDTMVSFVQRGGAENAASAADYELNDVTMLAGSDSVRATLSIVEDMEADAGHAMGEQLIIYAMAGDAESDDLMFTIWDEAVPALPLIAQLLLALFLMAGGARLYRRRQS